MTGLLSARQRVTLEQLVVVPDGVRYSDLERRRKRPATPSGRNLEKALNQAAEIAGWGSARWTWTRMCRTAGWWIWPGTGMAARAQALRRHRHGAAAGR